MDFFYGDKKIENSIIISTKNNCQETIRWNNKEIYIDTVENERDLKNKFHPVDLELYKEDLVEWNNRGTDLFNAGNYEEAIKYYDKALNIYKDFQEVLYNKATLLYYMGEYPLSIKYFDRSLFLDRKNIKSWLGKGAALSAISEYEEAAGCFDKILKIDINYAEAWYNKSCIMARQNKYEEALIYLDRAMAINPLIREETIKDYDKVLETDPENTEIWYYKSFILYHQNKYRDALECIDKVLSDKKDYNCLYLKELILTGRK